MNNKEDSLQAEKLHNQRHSLAHILLMALKEHYPHAFPTIGPVIDNGFYYDIDFGTGVKPGASDLATLEKTQKEIIEKYGVDVQIINADVRNFDEMKNAVEALPANVKQNLQISIRNIQSNIFLHFC